MKRIHDHLAPAFVAAALLTLSGCSGGGAGPLVCSTDGECPSGARCDLELQRCIEAPSSLEDAGGVAPDAGGLVPDAGGHTPDAGEQTPPGFELSLSPASGAVDQGASIRLAIHVVRSGGHSGEVSVALRDPPSGISAEPLRIGPQENSGSLLVQVGFSAATGPLDLHIAGSSGTLVRTVSFALTVRPVVVAVEMTSPAADLHTNGTVSIQLLVSGAQPDEVQLLHNGAVLSVLVPPYQYAWDTRNEAEGEHTISARAIIDGQTFGGPVRRIWVDRIPPAITGRTPVSGAANLEVTGTFSATFSEPLRPASVTDQSVLVTRGSTTIGKSLNLSADGRTLTITPTDAPVPPATFTITFNGVTDHAGNALASSAWTFTFPAWLPVGPPLSATGGATPAKNPQMRLDPMGRPVVAWIESDGTTDNGYVSRWNGTAWQSLGTLNGNSAAGTHVSRIHLALDASGNPIAAWNEGSIVIQRRQGTAWTNISTASLPSSNGPIPLEFTVTGAGEFLILIHNWPDTSVHRWQNGSWTVLLADQDLNYPADVYRCAGGSFSVAADGTILMARSCSFWDEYSVINRSRVVVWQRVATSGAWQLVGSPLSANASLGCYTGLPQLRIDPNQRPIVTWAEQCNSGANFVRAARLEGLSWSLLGGPLNWNGSDAQNPRLELLANGLPVVAWDGLIGVDRQIGVSRFDGTAWAAVGAGASASNALNTPATKPALAVDATGLVYIAFAESVGNGGDIHVWRQNR